MRGDVLNFIPRVRLGFLLVLAVLVASVPVLAQQDMTNMPGMSKSKPKPKSKATSRKPRKATRKNQSGRKHDLSNMAGMNMPGMKMSGMHRRRLVSGRKRTQIQKNSSNKARMRNMPGMKMPAQPSSSTKSASPQPSPQPMKNMPGMQMAMPSSSPGTQPAASPQMNMPGMQMPTASPNPQAQQKMDMNMPMPSASPAAGSMGQMPGSNMSGMKMNMGPLMVLNGNDMGIRLGSSDTNVASMGAMGSGTSWQPSSGPMHMLHKVAGDWLLMFHYNLVVGVNRQGGPRGVTRAESANWFMPMAYHKLGKGTVQLRGMFSFEPFTFPQGGSPLLFQTGETYKVNH